MKIGIIQSRGLGDIVIALPIALHYHKLGYEVHWPICEEFISNFIDHVPFVKWHPVTTDSKGLYFYDTPKKILSNFGIGDNETLYLYQYLSGHSHLTDPEYFALLKFDQYKYQKAGVPFLDKWKLGECLGKDYRGNWGFHLYDRCIAHLNRINPNHDPFVLVHLQGSDFSYPIENLSMLTDGLKVINIDEHKTDSIFDWVIAAFSATKIVCIDSVFVNMFDQLNVHNEKYFIRRSAWDVTPVLGQQWTFISTNQTVLDPKRVVL